jgi:hypothetical protein
MITSIAASGLCWLLSQALGEPLDKAVDRAAEQLRAEERRYSLGAAASADLLSRRREWIRARRAVAQSDGSAAPQVRVLFEEEIHAATQQLTEEERRYHLGVSSDDMVTIHRRDVLSLRRSLAGWKAKLASSRPEERKAAELEVRALLEEEIGVVDRQLKSEERSLALGASTQETVSKLREDLAALRGVLQAQ